MYRVLSARSSRLVFALRCGMMGNDVVPGKYKVSAHKGEAVALERCADKSAAEIEER